MENTAAGLIKSINKIDHAIDINEAKIANTEKCLDDLNEALRMAKEAEQLATAEFVSSPDDATQKALEMAREFVHQSELKVKLFENNTDTFTQDNRKLYAKRKASLAELVRLRITQTRPALEKERSQLMETLEPQLLRLLVLTAHLDGGILLQLNINRLFKNSGKFKLALGSAEKTLRESFEYLDTKSLVTKDLS